MFQGQKTVFVNQKKEMCWKVRNARQSNHTCISNINWFTPILTRDAKSLITRNFYFFALLITTSIMNLKKKKLIGNLLSFALTVKVHSTAHLSIKPHIIDKAIHSFSYRSSSNSVGDSHPKIWGCICSGCLREVQRAGKEQELPPFKSILILYLLKFQYPTVPNTA